MQDELRTRKGQLQHEAAAAAAAAEDSRRAQEREQRRLYKVGQAGGGVW